MKLICLTGTIILKSGKLSDVILQPKELTKGVNETVSSPAYDGAYYAAQTWRCTITYMNFQSQHNIAQGWSLPDIMFVTKQNMGNVVASVSKQLENKGDQVYRKLQPYRKVVAAILKLVAKYFGPYKTLEKLGHDAYKLTLLESSRVYYVFHVSQLLLGKTRKYDSDVQVSFNNERKVCPWAHA
ncbi:uncharacterized protein LOC141684920 [Apium graveolens]|uniref:uncharacterized protein LOC141684920 n=1 Tax=Apium graveolens TaxID=4045 RepID=UPI003D7A6D46